jgi:hypothetical protein
MSNPMSQDRVHFTISEKYLSQACIRDCIAETLGITQTYTQNLAGKYKSLHVICRPSQFARFVILRHVKYGQPNNMACLDMKLVVPPKEQTAYDVSKMPNTASGAP